MHRQVLQPLIVELVRIGLLEQDTSKNAPFVKNHAQICVKFLTARSALLWQPLSTNTSVQEHL